VKYLRGAFELPERLRVLTRSMQGQRGKRGELKDEGVEVIEIKVAFS